MAWLKKKLTGLSYRYLRGTTPWSHDRSPEIRHERLLPYASYAPWHGDQAFVRALGLVQANTLVDKYRLYELWSLVRQLDGLEGDFLEVGVWRGGSGCLLALANQRAGRQVFLADTFSGVVKAGSQDTRYQGGEHADTDVQLVESLAAKCGVSDSVKLLKGMFPEQNAECVAGQLALLHIDVDVYDSARDVLIWALPRLSTGSVVVFDDYGFFGCEGVTRLVNEFIAENPDFRFVHNLNGHAVLVRVAQGVSHV
ncbi:methyltransferase [Pseudomonas sp. 250J]|uniref:TylF/MycF family methyltransferase n=1 Tax=Pseudomonas peradeniyensis TaxID=2745488 RepID=A0ABT2VC54_9PSED|nr:MULTISPECIES: TylF/MycF/NovP-related O-methyltransferase [Pseudomonas]KNX76791.1 methyltransferase [Pseudomonas sp. 250J]MCU7239309.1 TylF/MycF family methyltransferase [Pseudomonas peradeniyensis]MCU7281547.1 TylF/MycF family methyltransferase [Pseudomonas peradeniyensis]QZA55893.1 TylF/MycF family methyltransferase [Pseudomonas sp. 2hn]